MASDKDRLKAAQWVLERNLAWIIAAEVKVGVIVAVDTAMLGGLAAAFSVPEAATRNDWANILTVSAAAVTGIGIFCASMAVLPRVTGPERSLLFFARIAKLDEPDYSDQFKKATESEFLDDWTTQIHRNAEIAVAKFAWVRRSMFWSFLAVLPWFAAIVMLVKR